MGVGNTSKHKLHAHHRKMPLPEIPRVVLGRVMGSEAVVDNPRDSPADQGQGRSPVGIFGHGDGVRHPHMMQGRATLPQTITMYGLAPLPAAQQHTTGSAEDRAGSTARPTSRLAKVDGAGLTAVG
jgi:hypothetical protein